MSRTSTIIKFEYNGYVRSRSWRVTTIIFMLLVIAASSIPHFMGLFEKIGGGNERESILVVSTAENTSDAPSAKAMTSILSQVAPDYDWQEGKKGDDPKALIEKGDYNLAIAYDGGESYTLYGTGHDFAVYTVQGILDSTLTETLRQSRISQLPADEQTSLTDIMNTQVTGTIETVGKGGAMQNFYLSYIMLYLLFIILMTYGQFVVTSVVNEKSTKTMELLITSAKPTQLMYGKVIGIGLVAVTQFALLGLSGILGMMVNFSAWEKRLPAVAEGIRTANFSPALIVWLAVFFVLGYLIYAFIYAALGATVSKIEDAGTVTSIPIMLLIIVFMVSIFSMQKIDSVFAKVMSYIPLSSPFAMFSRMSMGEAGVIQGLIALAIEIVFVVGIAWLAAKIYRVGVMMYGKPMKLGEISKAIKSKGSSRI